MCNITNHYGNANQNHNEISPHTTWMATIKNKPTTENDMCWQGCGGSGTLRHCWECKMVQLIWKIVWWLIKNFSIKLSYDPASPLLGIYPKELKWGPWRDICTLMFMAAWFTVGSDSKESACNGGDLGSVPGLGRFPAEEKGYPLQYCGLENSMD